MGHEYETVVLARKDRETTEELFKRVGKMLEMLLHEGYTAKVRYDEPGLGVVVIEYAHDNNLEYWGGSNLVWLNEDETDLIEVQRGE